MSLFGGSATMNTHLNMEYFYPQNSNATGYPLSSGIMQDDGKALKRREYFGTHQSVALQARQIQRLCEQEVEHRHNELVPELGEAQIGLVEKEVGF